MNRPIAFNGSAEAAPRLGTSKTYPCGFSSGLSLAGPLTVSSQDSHEPHGVGPPAQLRIVPVRLGAVSVTRSARVSKVRVVVPPPPRGSSCAGTKRGCR